MSNSKSNYYNYIVYVFLFLTTLYFAFSWYTGPIEPAEEPGTPTAEQSSSGSVENKMAVKIYGNGWIGCTDETRIKELMALKSSGESAAYRTAGFNAIQKGECNTFKEGEKVFQTSTNTADGLVQLNKKGEEVLYWADQNAIKNIMQ